MSDIKQRSVSLFTNSPTRLVCELSGSAYPTNLRDGANRSSEEKTHLLRQTFLELLGRCISECRFLSSQFWRRGSCSDNRNMTSQDPLSRRSSSVRMHARLPAWRRREWILHLCVGILDCNWRDRSHEVTLSHSFAYQLQHCTPFLSAYHCMGPLCHRQDLGMRRNFITVSPFPKDVPVRNFTTPVDKLVCYD